MTDALSITEYDAALPTEVRRQNGVHYTTEADILKVIGPLFLNDLRDRFNHLMRRAGHRRLLGLYRLLRELSAIHILDPACGTGNFLKVAYSELKNLERDIIAATEGIAPPFPVPHVTMSQMHGIEIDADAVRLGRVRHGLLAAEYSDHTPAHIVCANALTTDWNEVLPAAQCSYVVGNPPYAGTATTSAEQKQWLKDCYPPKYRLGYADFCSAWFVKAADYMAGNKDIRAAFVATNSICQGTQVPTLWSLLLSRGIQLHFAWPSFPWRSEAAGGAGVTVIIVGFGMRPPAHGARLYQLQGGQIVTQEGPALTPYLTLGRTAGVIVRPTRTTLSAPVDMVRGSMPTDGGHLILEYDEGEAWRERDPAVRPFLKRYVGSAELMQSHYRWCLWLKNEEREQWEQIPEIRQRVEACRTWREAQVKSGGAYKLRERPWSFREQRPLSEALVVPRVTSERRPYMPTAFVDERYVVADSSFMIPDADEAHFAVLSSRMHQCWIRLTAGRMKTDYRYSRDLVYNTFIWPEMNEEQHQALWKLGDAVLMRRERYYQMELGKLYNKLPEDLAELHQAIDDYVERLYRHEPFHDDEERTAFMLDLYTAMQQREPELSLLF